MSVRSDERKMGEIAALFSGDEMQQPVIDTIANYGTDGADLDWVVQTISEMAPWASDLLTDIYNN